jgi:hypothetical protein
VRVQVGHKDRYQPVQHIEILLQFGRLRVEQQMHVVLLYYLLHDLEGKGLVLKHQEQEPCYEIHALAVVQLLVHYCIRV